MIKALDYNLMCDCLQPGCAYCDQDGSRSKTFRNLFAKNGIVYFIAENYTGKWLMDICNFTSDPNEAIAFSSKKAAETYMNSRSWLKSCSVVEHDFLFY